MLALGGCAANKPSDNPRVNANLLTGPAPTVTHTPSEALLSCVAEHKSRSNDIRIAIGDIVDGTGAKTFSDGSSTMFTQRPDLMVTVALAKTGVTVLNRTSSRVSEWEMSQAMDKRLGDGKNVSVGTETVPYRPIEAGQILGSTHYLTGAITEVNWNIESSGNQYNIAGVHSFKSAYRISIAVDLVLTETTTTRVVKAESFTKQLVGLETETGVFKFFSVDNSVLDTTELFDASIGQQQNEPVQRALRWVLEYGTYDMVAGLLGASKACDPLLAPQTAAVAPAPVAAAAAAPVAAASPAPVAATPVAPVAAAQAPAAPASAKTPYIVPKKASNG